MKQQYLHFFTLLLSISQLSAAAEERIQEPSFDVLPELERLNPDQPRHSIYHNFTSFNQKKIETTFPAIEALTDFFEEIYDEFYINHINDKILQNSLRKDKKASFGLCTVFYKSLQKDIFSSIEYLKLTNQKTLNKVDLFKLHKKMDDLICKYFIFLTNILDRSHLIAIKHPSSYLIYKELHNAFFNLLKEINYINPEKKFDIINFKTEHTSKYLLGFLKDENENYLPFLINTKRNLSFFHITNRTIILAHDKKLLEKSGFFINEKRNIDTIAETNDSFAIRYVHGCNEKTPFYAEQILCEVFITEKEAGFWNMVDIKDQDAMGARLGFFSLPTSPEEKNISALDLIELIEATITQSQNVDQKTLEFINQTLNDHLALLFQDDLQTKKALEHFISTPPLYESESDLRSSDSSSSSSSSSSSHILSASCEDSLKEQILYKLSQVKKVCTEKILSDYERAIISEQEARKEGVILGTTTGKAKQNKGRGAPQKKKGNGKQEQKKQPAKIKPEVRRAEALKLLQRHQEKSKIKLRHMIQIINAMMKEQGLDEAHVRVRGSHYNFDLGEGSQSASFARPHGNKEGISISVANDFFNTLMNTLQHLDPETRKAMGSSKKK